MATKPKPYIPPPWQLPHLLSTPLGGTVLIVERCEEQPPEGYEGLARSSDAFAFGNEKGQIWLTQCPLGPVGTVLRIKGVGDFRTTAIDLRRVDTMTREESAQWGCTPDGYWRDEAEGRWENDNPGAKWGDWAWFITLERIEI